MFVTKPFSISRRQWYRGPTLSQRRSRAIQLLAFSFRQIASGNLQIEAFLENALAAAIEAPGYWPRLAAHLGWSGVVPNETPAVSTQDVVATGRTDIRLKWGSRSLVLELKAGAAPTEQQIQKYLDTGVDVAGVSKYPAKLSVNVPPNQFYLGVVTWDQIHSLDWPDAPLEVHQMRALLRSSEVVVPYVNLDALHGMVRSWSAWDEVDRWAHTGVARVSKALNSGKSKSWVTKEGSRSDRVDDNYQRFVRWAWPLPWNDFEGFGVYGGLFMGRENDATLVDGLPDVVIALHCRPNGDKVQALTQDLSWEAALNSRAQRTPNGVFREYRPGQWELIRDRAPAAFLLQSPNQEQALGDWLEARADEWVSDGLLLAELPRDARIQIKVSKQAILHPRAASRGKFTTCNSEHRAGGYWQHEQVASS